MSIRTMSIKAFIAAACLAFSLIALARAAEEVPPIAKESWSFGGIFGTYDENQLQRGFQVFREVCAGCHSARLLAFRNLAEPGGPGFSEGQVKALAAEYTIADPLVESGERPGVAADRWPSPLSEADAQATFGVIPPDFSVLAKARGTTQPFPWWILNYFTAYQEGGPDYIHALLNGYEETPPEGVELPDGKYYNKYYPGHAIGMGPPLADGLVDYADAEEATAVVVPETMEQYSRDVSAFMMWVAEPHMAARKETGFRVILFLVLLAGLMFIVKRRLWAGIEH